MGRSATGIALICLLSLALPARSADRDPLLDDVESLVFLARRHDRLWGWVDGRLAEAGPKLASDAGRAALAGLRYDFLVDWGRSRETAGGDDAVRDCIDIYGRALSLDLPADAVAGARERVVSLRLGEATRLLDTDGDLAVASAQVQAVLALEHLPESARRDGLNLGFRIDSKDADRLLAAGDLTRGFDALATVVKRYGGENLPAVAEARTRLESLERSTGVLTLSVRDVSGTLSGVKPEFVGEIVTLPGTVRIHRQRADFSVADAPVTEAAIAPGAPTRIRLLLEGGSRFSLSVPFPGGSRPDLRLPFDLSRRSLEIDLPDRIPLRMAYVPAAPARSPYFIGLYEVSAGEMNAFRRATGKPVGGRGAEDRPAQNLDMDEVQAFLDHAGVSLASLDEWRTAAVGDDGRSLPWGEGDATTRAHIGHFGQPLEPVTGRPEGVGPYGLHHVLGNVWELIEGGFAMGGRSENDYPLVIPYRLENGEPATWKPDLLRDPRPLEPAGRRMAPGDEMRRKWSRVLFTDPEAARVKQPGIGLRVVVRVGAR